MIWTSVGWAKRSVPIKHVACPSNIMMGTKKPLSILQKPTVSILFRAHSLSCFQPWLTQTVITSVLIVADKIRSARK